MFGSVLTSVEVGLGWAGWLQLPSAVVWCL